MAARSGLERTSDAIGDVDNPAARLAGVAEQVERPLQALLGQIVPDAAPLSFKEQTKIAGRNTGQPSQYVSFDHLGAIAFEPDATPVSSVPEPSTWAMLITGFFLTGVAGRRRGNQALRRAGAP